jgi:hypothetical protein
VVAVLVDVVYQLLELPRFRPLQALILAFALAVLPYLLVRGPVSRLARRVVRRAPTDDPAG